MSALKSTEVRKFRGQFSESQYIIIDCCDLRCLNLLNASAETTERLSRAHLGEWERTALSLILSDSRICFLEVPLGTAL